MLQRLLADLTPPDWLFLVWLFGFWIVYSRLANRSVGGRLSLNRHMAMVRVDWMRNMLHRDNRVMDGMLMGHLINSVSFFASTSVLLLAGLVGGLAGSDKVHQLATDLGVASRTSQLLFEVKLLLLIGIFVYAFFKFTWAVRQYNYTIALIGAAPLAPGPRVEEVAEGAAQMMSMAVRNFNAGMRAYYYAFASLGWFVHPYASMAAVAWVTFILYSRQFRSPALAAVQRYLGERPDRRG